MLLAVPLLGLAFAPVPLLAQTSPTPLVHSIEIHGELRPWRGNTPEYVLTFRHDSGLAAASYDAIAVTAQPSGKRLAMFLASESNGNDTLSARMEKGALVTITGEMQHLDTRLTIPYDPFEAGEDQYVSVSVISGEHEYYLAYAHVDATNFGFESRVSSQGALERSPNIVRRALAASTNGLIHGSPTTPNLHKDPGDGGDGGGGGGYEHCCHSQSCSQFCITCAGPYFSCNVIDCTITCN